MLSKSSAVFKTLYLRSQLEISRFFWKGKIQLFREIHDICIIYNKIKIFYVF